MNLKRFFQWLTLHPGYKSQLKYSDAEYVNLSGKDAPVATARGEQRAPTLNKSVRYRSDAERHGN
jgi:integrase/recombinase XerD